MKVRAGFVAGVVALAAAGAYTAWEIGRDREETVRKEREGRLFDLIPDRVDGLEIDRRDGGIGLARSEKGWRMTRPVEEPADREVVAEILRQLGNATVLQTVESAPESVERYGLGETATRVSVRTSDGGGRTVAIGSPSPAEEGVYARVGDGPVLLAGPELRLVAGVDARLLIERVLVPGAERAVSVEVRPAGGTGHRVALGGQGWVLEQPFRFPADSARMRELLAALASQKLEPAAGAPPGAREAGLDPPRAVVVCSVPGEPDRRLALGGPEGETGLWIRSGEREEIFRTDAARLGLLLREPAAWCDLRPAPVDRYRVTELSLQMGDLDLRLEREGNGWKDALGRPAEGDAVLALLATLCGNPARGIDPRPSPRPAAAQVLLAALIEEGGARHGLEAWGPERDGSWRARREGWEPVLLMPPDYVGAVRARAAALAGP